MSVIDLVCPNCHAAVFAPARLAGQSLNCRRCDSAIPVPGDSGGPAPSADGGFPGGPGGPVGALPFDDMRPAFPGGTLGLRDGPQSAVPQPPAPGGTLGLRSAAAGPLGAQPPPFESPFIQSDRSAPLQPDLLGTPHAELPSRSIPALVGAVVGAVLGAVLWAAVGAVTGYEIGWVAWGIGAGVGWGAAVMGGRGPAIAAACAALTLCAIFGGKLAAVAYVLPHEVGNAMSEMISREMYSEYAVDAAAFVVLGPTPSNDDIRDCMVRRGYYVDGEAWEIPDEQVTAFRSEIAPGLVAFQEESPPYEVWRRRIVDETVDELLAEVSTIEMLKESVSGFDLLWVLLGMSSAFGLVMRRSQA